MEDVKQSLALVAVGLALGYSAIQTGLEPVGFLLGAGAFTSFVAATWVVRN